MCGHKQFGIWEVSKITVVDSNVVNHWLMTGAINIPTILIVTVLCQKKKILIFFIDFFF